MRTEIAVIIAGMAAVTCLTRISFLVLANRVSLPGFVMRGLRFIPVGILTALVVPGLVSAMFAARYKNGFFAMGSGMVVITILNLIATR
ncbi:MAG: AzlD domain-containing protein [Bacillota bacterium]